MFGLVDTMPLIFHPHPCLSIQMILIIIWFSTLYHILVFGKCKNFINLYILVNYDECCMTLQIVANCNETVSSYQLFRCHTHTHTHTQLVL